MEKNVAVADEKLSTMNFMGMSADSAKVIVRTLREVLDPDGGRA